MARKKRIEIIDKELTPTVLYTKKDKKGGVLWVFLIFAVFIGLVIFLPDITEYVNSYLNPDVDTPITPIVDEDENDEDDEEDINIIKHTLSNDLIIEESGFSVSNFNIANNQLSFTITNTGTSILDFSQLNYFINLYNNANTLLQRIMVTNQIVVNGGTSTFTYDLVDANVSSIAFLEITPDEYPVHNLPTDANNNATLTCTKDYETVNYVLTNNKVTSIEDIFNVPATDPNYSTLYSNYQALAATYNTFGGINSSVTVLNNVMTFRTTLNLNTITNNPFDNIIYYEQGTDAKVIYFELEASGYTCN